MIYALREIPLQNKFEALLLPGYWQRFHPELRSFDRYVGHIVQPRVGDRQARPPAVSRFVRDRPTGGDYLPASTAPEDYARSPWLGEPCRCSRTRKFAKRPKAS